MIPFILVQTTAFSGIGGFLGSIGLMAQAVLAVLILFSLVSWAVIIGRTLALRRALAQSETFVEIFRRSSKFSEVNAVCVQLKSSPLVALFQAGFAEVNQQMRVPQAAATQTAPRTHVRSLDAVSRALARASGMESLRLEKGLAFLSTTAAITPFIGLFGTVWGIMNAFEKISTSNSASLAIVAGPIAEALITTAMGLAAAIPAAMGNNYLASRGRWLGALMDDFALEFINIVERNFS